MEQDLSTPSIANLLPQKFWRPFSFIQLHSWMIAKGSQNCLKTERSKFPWASPKVGFIQIEESLTIKSVDLSPLGYTENPFLPFDGYYRIFYVGVVYFAYFFWIISDLCSLEQ